MPSRPMTIGYEDRTVPPGQNVPVTWWFQLRDAQGNQVGTEQSYLDPPATVTVSGPAGTYLVRGGQRDHAGGELGVAIESAPFDFLADVLGRYVQTIQVG